MLREHNAVPLLLRRTHRFLAAEADGLLDLSKELTKLFIERIDVPAIAAAIGIAKSENKLGSLKALEKLAAHHVSDSTAGTMMAPLFGIYDLRLADAHLGSSKVDSAKQRVGVLDTEPAPMQGRQLLQSFLDALGQITEALDVDPGKP